jgi:hypothetical protein
VLAVGLAENASAKANSPNAEARTLEGTWWVQVTALTDCVSHVPLMSFTALLTFANGGTMMGTTTNPAFAIGQRSPDHGVWFRSRAVRTYRASSVALLLFGTAPNFPATPGFQAGSHRLTQAIDVTDPGHFTLVDGTPESRQGIQIQVVAGRVRLSGLAMFVALLGGLQAFGALGIILGPVLFATAAAILDALRDMQRSHGLRADVSEQKVV